MHFHGHSYLGRDDEELLGKVYDHQVVRRLMAYALPYWKFSLISGITMLIYTGTAVAVPWIIGWGIDTYIQAGDMAGLNIVGLVFGATLLFGFIAQYIHQATLARVSQGVLYDLRVALFDHLQHLPMPYFDRREVGRIMSRVQNDVQQLQEFLSIVLLSMADLLSILGIVGVMMAMNTRLALITLAVIPFLVVILAIWQKSARRSFTRVRHAIATVNANLQESISGVRVVQSMNRQGVNIHRFDQLNYEHLDANMQTTRLSAVLIPMVEILIGLSLSFVVIFGGTMVFNGLLTGGVLVAFTLYIQRFFDPIRNLTMQYTQLQRAMTSGTRIFELLDVRPEITDNKGACSLPRIKGNVRYENVSFSYSQDIPVLENINLSIEAGQTVALVGPTGAGKTTMVNLLARFYDTTKGRITIDGYDTRQVTRNSLGRQMGIVLQEPFLFSGTIMENIRYNHADVADDQVILAAKAVGAHEYISELKKGYATILHERGRNLSVGQRQLLSLARALAADPAILILDEATANIDSYSEALIQSALRNLFRERSAVVIAHRLSTIINTDLIVVLDKGRIKEQGTHQALLAKDGMYASMFAPLMRNE
jgi:ABC-type multidrug transport system fused ATPase/permease subunit